MRIAIIAEVFIPKVDGVVRRTLNLISQLQQSGDEIRVYCPESDVPRISPVPVVEFPSFPCPSYPEYLIGRPDARLIEDLQRFQPDVIHVLNPLAFGFQCCELIVKSSLNRPLVFSFHTLYAEFVKTYPLLWALSRPIWWLTRHYHNQANLNLTVSAMMAEDLTGRGFHHVELWPPAVDSSQFSPGRRNWEMRCRLTGNHPEQPLVVTVSRLAPEKNVGFLADVMRQIPEACLAIIGEGPQRSELERRFSPVKTHFVGYLHGTELAQAYASSDAFVYASETETMGNVILEAQSSGLPVIAAEAGGVRSLIRHEVDGLFYRPGSTVQAVQALRTVLFSPAYRSEMGAAAASSARQRTWENSAAEVRRFYQVAIDDVESDDRKKSRSVLAGVFARQTTRLIVQTLSTVSSIRFGRRKFTRSQPNPDTAVHNCSAESSGGINVRLQEPRLQERSLAADRSTHETNSGFSSVAVSDHR